MVEGPISPTRLIVFTALLLTLPLTSVAMLGVEEELSVIVPGLQYELQAVDCRDLNGDGTPEILTADHGHIVLYDPARDSVLFADSLVGFLTQKVLLADINRDQVPDLTVAGTNEYGGEFIISAYDGASDYADIDSLRSDGSSMLFWGWGFPGGGTTVGTSRLYESFPDSLIWQRGALLSQMGPVSSRIPEFGSEDTYCLFGTLP